MFGVLAATGGGYFVHASSELVFKTKMYYHILRVRGYMVMVYRKFPDQFTHINEDLIGEHGAYHDLPKIMTLAKLKEWDYPYSEDIGLRLSRYDGQNKDDLNRADRRILDQTIEELNRIETAIKEEWFFKRLAKRYPNLDVEGARQELNNLEHWADVFDTSVFRMDELNLQNFANSTPISFLLKEGEVSDFAIKVIEYLRHSLLARKDSPCAKFFYRSSRSVESKD